MRAWGTRYLVTLFLFIFILCRENSSSDSEEEIRMVKEKTSRIFVLKRDGRKEPVHFDKITSRIEKLCYGLDMDYIDAPSITLKVCF
jgi:hypothetical protein